MEGKAAESLPSPASAEVAPPPPAETLAEAPRRRGGALKRKAAPNFSSTSTPSKRLVKERNALYPFPPSHNGPVTRARQSPNKLAAALQSSTAPPPAPAFDGGREAAADLNSIRAEEEELPEDIVVDLEFDAVRSRGSNVHAVPTHAGWFSWNGTHPIEKHTMSSFFNGKSENRTQDIYLEVRNFIMKKFHADPQTQVELKDLDELSVGDMDTRQEVMEFLDHWGLINFHPFLPTNTEVAISDARGVDETSSVIEKFYQFEAVPPCPRIIPKKTDLSTPLFPRLLPEPAIADDLVTPAGPSVEYHCNSCSADCSRKRYHCQKQADFDLCTECYNEGKFGSGMAAADFILMEPADVLGVSGGSWTDQETLLLLEALELFGENWTEIAEHVATKTKTQCMLHFIQMPIEDPFFESKDHANDNIHENMDPGLDNKETATLHAPDTKETKSVGNADEPVSSPTDGSNEKDHGETYVSCTTDGSIAIDALKAAFQAVGYLPEPGGSSSFAEAGNPVMALAAFLVRLVDTGVATNSSRASLKAISEDSPAIQLAARHCFLLEDPPNDRKDSPPSESAVVGLGSGEAKKEEDKMPIPCGTDESKVCTEKNETNAVSMEKEMEPSICSRNSSEKVADTKELGDPVLPLEITLDNTKDSSGPSLVGEQIVDNANKDTSRFAPPTMLTPGTSKESGDLALEGGDAPVQVKEISDPEMVEDKPNSLKQSEVKELNDSEMVEDKPICLEQSEMQEINDSEMVDRPNSLKQSEVKETNDLEMVEDKPNTLKQSEAEKTNDSELVQDKANSLKQKKDTSDAADTVPTSAPVEEQDPQVTTALGSTIECTEKTGEDDKRASPSEDENCNSAKADDVSNLNKLKRAAVTALSAAAVKATLLASQEEEHIRQLVSLIIEKQLRKLETKLSLFAEMEGLVMRVKEQIDRARQRLLHERAQIVAVRLGLPGSSLPTNKIATVLRPLNMASQKPPLMRRP